MRPVWTCWVCLEVKSAWLLQNQPWWTFCAMTTLVDPISTIQYVVPHRCQTAIFQDLKHINLTMYNIFISSISSALVLGCPFWMVFCPIRLPLTRGFPWPRREGGGRGKAPAEGPTEVQWHGRHWQCQSRKEC